MQGLLIKGRLLCGHSLASSSHSATTITRSHEPRRHIDRLRVWSSDSGSLYSASNPTATRQRLFGDIAPVYDELNQQLSLGQHRVWKRMAVKWAAPQRGSRCLDICCGSGDLAFLLAEASGRSGQVVALDFAEEMLEYAERRQLYESRAADAAPIEWVLGDATQLPFPEASFDAATMGYGLRNVASIPAALQELRRVLRPAAAASILDFNNASQSNPLADAVQGWALENVVVPAAKSWGLEEEYRYLRPSILAFPTALKPLESLVRFTRGFSSVPETYEIVLQNIRR